MTTIQETWARAVTDDTSLPRVLISRDQDTPGDFDAEASAPHGSAGNFAKGFASGLVIVVPAVLWLHGPSRPSSEHTHKPAVVISQVAIKPVVSLDAMPAGTTAHPANAAEPPVGRLFASAGSPPAFAAPSGFVAPSLVDRGAAPPPAPANEAPPPEPIRTAYAERLEEARQLALSGDLDQARGILDDPDLTSHADAVYLHAETYDPNVLAVLGLTDAHADSDRSKQLYARAFDLGITTARQRIEALQ